MFKIIVFWLALLPPALFAQQVDTLWSVPQLDGGIGFRPVSGLFNMSNSGFVLSPGDGWDWILMEEVFERDYLSFNLSQLSNTDSIVGAIIGIYQFEAIGNDQGGVYPIWNVAGGDTHFCVLDHVDYGFSLDLGDWTAGDPGDPQTLHTNIGIISDSANIGYKTLDVTPYVKEDIANQRIYNQYRLRFTVDIDYDSLMDKLRFISGEVTGESPYLVISYDSLTALQNPVILPGTFELLQNYPNPFNAGTIIQYSLAKPGSAELTIYNLLGRKVYSVVYHRQIPGSYKVNIDASLWPSGVYYYRLTFNNHSIIKKMLLIR